jgi:deazaflavin-dependent oxidoreductase (nitroreductase family)
MWILLLALLGGMALIVLGSMVALHWKASELSGSEGQPRGMQNALALLVNRIVTRLLRAGIPVKIFGNPVVLITVAGRKTGQPRTTLVDLYESSGRRFLVSTHGAENAHWVNNLRAAGTGTLSRGRRLEDFTAIELKSDIAGRVLMELLGPRLASPLGGLALRQTLELPSNASLDDYMSAARSHPVFALSTPGEASADDPSC